MTASFQYDGIWWDPRDPNTRWVGTLRFDQRDGATLSITVPTDKPDLFPALMSYDLLLGVTTGGKEVTLIGCFDRFTQGSLLGIPRPIKIFANALIVGFHCDEHDAVLSTAAASLRHMNQWWGRSGIASDLSVKWPDTAVRYTSTAPVLVHDNGRFQVSIRSVVSGSVGDHKASLLEDVRFEVHAGTPAPLSHFQPIVQTC